MPSTLETQSMTGEANGMTISPFAGKPAPKEMLIDVARRRRNILSAIPIFTIPTS